MSFKSGLKAIWDRVMLNNKRLERGMEPASLDGGAQIGLGVMTAVAVRGAYNESAWLGLGIVVLLGASFATLLTHMQSRAEISKFDEDKRKEFTTAAVEYARQNGGPQPPAYLKL